MAYQLMNERRNDSQAKKLRAHERDDVRRSRVSTRYCWAGERWREERSEYVQDAAMAVERVDDRQGERLLRGRVDVGAAEADQGHAVQ